jgi:orotate phosphoribosyltransferase-like protein
MSVGVPYCTYFSIEDQYELYLYKKSKKNNIKDNKLEKFFKIKFTSINNKKNL